MRVPEVVSCPDFPCLRVDTRGYLLPNVNVNPQHIKVLMIAEAPPKDPQDYFYAQNTPFYLRTTIQAFQDAGVSVSSMEDITSLGIYLTTAIKCVKIGYSIPAAVIKQCSFLLEKEFGLFPHVQSILLMGDTAIKAFNYITRRTIGKRAIPSGSTYKIRRNPYYYNGLRVFPSYLQTGKSYLIEHSKRKMIAEDIQAALQYAST